eukprot:996988-Amphidinium_carterae.1
MAETAAFPGPPATVAHRIADQRQTTLSLTLKQREQMIHILNNLNYTADPAAPVCHHHAFPQQKWVRWFLD